LFWLSLTIWRYKTFASFDTAGSWTPRAIAEMTMAMFPEDVLQLKEQIEGLAGVH
jgi:hypothetical protein